MSNSSQETYQEYLDQLAPDEEASLWGYRNYQLTLSRGPATGWHDAHVAGRIYGDTSGDNQTDSYVAIQYKLGKGGRIKAVRTVRVSGGAEKVLSEGGSWAGRNDASLEDALNEIWGSREEAATALMSTADAVFGKNVAGSTTKWVSELGGGGYDQALGTYEAPVDEEGAPVDVTVHVIPEDELAKDAAISAIEEEIKRWEAYTTSGGMDAVEGLVKGYIANIKEKEEDVIAEYEEVWDEAEGTIFGVKDIWETAVERGKEKYTTDIGTAVTEREEGLEETVLGREEGLGVLREEYIGTPTAKGKMREAEAKIGAAGFASTGVGRTAREILAEEIGEEAIDIDEGFTEERSDVKQSYLTKTDPLEKEFGEGGTAYEDYITTRDDAATTALAAWKTKSKEYLREKERYEEITLPAFLDPMGEANTYAGMLGDISSSISAIIGDIRSGTYGTSPDPSWDPFASGDISGFDPSTASTAQFGIDPSTMMFTRLPEDVFDLPFYEPYEEAPGLSQKLYDPEKLLPWETLGGDPTKPGGQG